MGSSPLPIPGVNTNDPGGGQISPADLLRRIYAQQQPTPTTQGQVSTGPAMPQPHTQRSPMPLGPQQAAGEYATKGAHTRASMQSLGQTLQNTVATANNAMLQHEQKVLSQKTDAYSHAVQGISQADEMLKADPTNAEAAQMKARNQDFLKAFLDPTTPEGKKNIKMLVKAYGVQDGEKTPEQVAAEGSAKKVQAQTKLVAQAQNLQSGKAFPQTAGISPISQIHAQEIKEGLQPKAATGTAILNNQEHAAQALNTSQDKQAAVQAKEQMQKERLGLDDKGQPKPLEQLPPAMQAKVKSERATDDYKKAQAEFDAAKTKALSDPNSLQNRALVARTSAMSTFAQASALRAKVQLFNYDMNAFGKDKDGNPLPGSQNIGGTTVGARMAALTDKVLGQQAQFLDIDGGTDLLDSTIQNMKSSGDRLNDPRIVKLLTDRHITETGNMEAFNSWMDSGAASTLNPNQRDYVVAVKQARERIQGLRKMVGQGVSNQQVDNLLTTLPGAKTPDADYAERQLKAVRGLTNNLKQSVPKLNIPGIDQSGAGTQGGQKAPAPKSSDKLTNDLTEALKF